MTKIPTTSNPKKRGLYVVRINTDPEATVGLWDGKHWSLWCEMWDPPEWDPAQCLNCAVVEWAYPDRMSDMHYNTARQEKRLFTTERKKP